ncbi:MAG: AMP-binding protein [Terriglobales bacterium]
MPDVTATLASLPGYIHGMAGLGSRPAVVEQGLYRGASFTYAELIGRAFAFQAELGCRGVRAGDRVMVWGASGAAWAIAFYGCVLAGAVVVPLDAAFSAELAARVLRQTEAALLVTDHDAAALSAPTLAFAQVAALTAAPPPPRGPDPDPGALLEIVYTSGATADPKGVMITHGNLLANLRPVATEVHKYLARARLLLPLRFLHLIPLSHLFGQVMGLFIPALIESAVVYPESQAPAQWAALIRRHRVSVVVAVPQQLQLFSQWAVGAIQTSFETAAASGKGRNIPWRWWRWRKLHRRLGWRMWAFVVGGASLPDAQEAFWNSVGYAVIQGYGLTETAPAITITHPFRPRRGGVGRVLAGVETRIAADGEILVRGGNVSPGYYRNPGATAEAFSDGWLHTGDLGSLDGEGNLRFLGRKKEVIVTAAGLNVYPDDVERALALQAPIEDCAAVEDQRGGAPQVHAVVVLRSGADAGQLPAAIAAANASLEPHQRISAATIWPRPQLPRTASTRKLQRTAIARWVNQGEPATPEAVANGNAGWKVFLQQRWGIAPSRLQPDARLDRDLGLSSLDRVELWSWLEAHTAAGFDESTLVTVQTVAELETMLDPASGNHAYPPGATPSPRVVPAAAVRAPAWAIPADEKSWPMRAGFRRFRAVAYFILVFPVLRTVVLRIRVEGRDSVARLQRPVLFIANHQSLLDVPLVLWGLPRAWRPWLAPAMGVEPYAGAFDPGASAVRRFRDRWRLRLARLFFNGYLLSPRGAVAASLRHTGHLADRGFCPIIFPEGARTPDGRLHAFRPGIGVFAAALRLPIVPIQLEGLYRILPDRALVPHPGAARIRFGEVMQFPTESAEEITARLEAWFTMSAQ